jgi:serine/threonine-protein kinase
MLAGQPPHVGGSAQQIIMKIIAESVAPVTQFRKSVPANVAAATAKALEKLPADRFESARAFGDALGNSTFTTAAIAGSATGARARGGVSMVLFTATAAVALVAAGGLLWSLRRPAAVPQEPVVRVAVDLQPGERLYPAQGGSTIAISPDGGSVVYVAQGSTTAAHLMIRRTGELTAQELVPTVVTQPAFSPDGRWVAYVDGNQIKKVPAAGGASSLLTAVAGTAIRGLCWLGPDSILMGADAGMYTLPSGGGALHRVTGVDSIAPVAFPVLLPGGQAIAYTTGGTVTTRRLAVFSLASHHGTVFEMSAAAAIGVREGHLLFVTSNGDLQAVSFDPKGQRLTGDAVQIESGIRIGGPGVPLAALSTNGSLWFISGQPTGYLEHIVAGRADVHLLDDMRAFRNPRFSPDGRTIAVAVAGTNGSAIWLYDIAGKTFTKLSDDGAFAEWSGDGKHVLFRSVREGKSGVWWQPADGSGKAELLYQPEDVFNEAILSPDGKWLIYRTAPGLHNRDIYAVPLDGDKKPVLLVGGPFQESHPRLSPDGKWLAYQSNETSRFEIYVRPFPNNGPRVQISNQGGSEPIWARSGNAIIYRTIGGGVESAAVTRGATVVPGERRELLPPSDFLNDVTHQSYDVWPDGNGFLMVKPAGADARPIFVYNWGRVLHEKVSVAR